MILTELKNANLINPPEYVLDNLCLLSFGGSISYGVNTPDSDIDLIGFYIPPIEYIYQPGIYNFDKINVAEVYSVHHIQYNRKSYDITIYPITNLFKLALDGNSIILDFLVSSSEYIIYENDIGTDIRDNAFTFLSKKCVPKFLGFATSELASVEKRLIDWNNYIDNKDVSFLSKIPASRIPLYQNFKYDTKHMGNLVRLIASLNDILTRRHYCPSDYSENIRKVRNGEYKFEDIKKTFLAVKETIPELERSSKLQDEPDRDKIRNLLVNSIEKFLGDKR